MTSLSTTKLSSKGQIVIPEDIRHKLNLHTGDQFIVIAEKDVVILKTIAPISMREFDPLIAKARRAAKLTKLSKQDIKAAIMEARKQ